MLVRAGELFVEEFVDRFVVKTLPARFLGARIDRIKERVVRQRRLIVARSVADHQRSVLRIQLRERQRLLLRPDFLPADRLHERKEPLVFPFLNQRGLRRRGDDQHVRLPLQLAQRIRDFRERRNALADDTVDRFVDRDRPSERFLHQRIARLLDVFGQRDVPQLRFGVHPVDQNLRNFDRDAATRDFRTLVQESKNLDQRRKAVDSARLRVKVDEFRRLASVFANALQAPMLDNIRNETLFMFQLHRVERATVGVDSDEKIAIFLKIDH